MSEKKQEKTLVSEGLPIYLMDKIGLKPKKEKKIEKKVEKPIIKEVKKEIKKEDTFVKNTKEILKTSQKKKKTTIVHKEKEFKDVSQFILPHKVIQEDSHLIIQDKNGDEFYTFFINIFPDGGSLIDDLHLFLTDKGYLFQQFNFIYNLNHLKVVNDLKKKSRLYQQAIYERQKRDGDILDLSYDSQEVFALREHIKTGQLKMIEMGIVLQFFISKEDFKNNLHNVIVQDLQSIDFKVNKLRYLQKKFYEGIYLEQFKDDIKKQQYITTFQIDNNNIAYFNLLGRSGYESSEGLYIGDDYESGNMIFRDLWNQSNYNFLSVGKSGGGKSFASKTILTREYSMGTSVYIIDPENEFEELTKQLGGEIIDIKKEENKLNPFDFTYIHNIDKPYLHKILKEEGKDQLIKAIDDMKDEFVLFAQGLENFIKLIIKKEGGSTKNNYLINEGILKYFEKLGCYIDNPKSYFNLKENIGNLKGFYELMLEIEEPFHKQDRIISNHLKKYATGTLKGLLGSGKSNLSLNSQWTCFKFKGLDDEIKDIMIFLTARFLAGIMVNPSLKNKRKRLLIDEFHVFLEEYDIVNYFLQILKRGRKYKMGLGIITQTIDDLFREFKGDKVNKSIGNDFINNIGFTLLMGQKGNTIKNLSSNLSLGNNETQFLKDISGGKNEGVGLLITEGKNNRSVNKIFIQAEDFLKKII